MGMVEMRQVSWETRLLCLFRYWVSEKEKVIHSGEAQREMSRHYVTSFDFMRLTKALIR